ncbi:MAG TPA: M1 family aminopeptidase [candidate division Zixibacteria bacterium]|nr:M1 family aminopeptidase [candidate division Zixibacteria bacterium]
MTNYQKYLETLVRSGLKEAEQEQMMGREDFTFPDAKDQWQPPRPYLIDNLKMNWKLMMEEASILAQNELLLTSKMPDLDIIELHAADLEIEVIKDQNKNKLKFDHDPEKHSLIIYLKESLGEGISILLTIDYKVANPITGGYFIIPNEYFPDLEMQFWTHFQDDYARYLIPIYDHPSCKFPVEMIATVPNGFYAVSNGSLLEINKNKDGTESFHWKQDQPVPSYLITLAVGKFEVYQEKANELDVFYYAEKKFDKETVYRSLGKTPDMIKFFSKKLGVKYPWKKYGQVCVSNFVIGGMENTSVTTLTDTIFHEEKIHKDYSSEGLVAHELVHQWIGDLITCKSWSHGWINEGGATQLQNEWKKYDLGEDEYLYEQYGKQESYFNEDKNRYRRSIVQTKWTYGMDVFDAHLYPGAAWRYYMLKHLVGEDIWWQVLGYFLTKNAYTSVETIDFQRAFEDITGNDFDWYFDQWLYKAGYPEVKIKCSYDPKEKQVSVRLEQTQKLEGTPDVFRFPFTIQIISANGNKEQFTNEITEKIHTFYYSVEEKPEMIEIDPNYAILMDVTIEKPIEMWLNQLTKGSNVIMRIRAAQTLGSQAAIKAIQALNDAILNEEFWGVQVEIAKTLGNLKTNLALEGLLKATTVKDSRARTAVATALGNFFKEEKALIALEKLLDDKESYFVIGSAATSIGKIQCDKSFEILTKRLPKVSSSWTEIVIRGYLTGLVESGKIEALDILLPYLDIGKSDYIRREVVNYISKLGKKYKKERPEIKQLLEKTLLNDISHRVVRGTISAFSEYGDAALIPALEQIEKTSFLYHLRRAAKNSIRNLSKKKDENELKSVQKSVEELQKENRDLKERLEKVEAQISKKK